MKSACSLAEYDCEVLGGHTHLTFDEWQSGALQRIVAAELRRAGDPGLGLVWYCIGVELPLVCRAKPTADECARMSKRELKEACRLLLAAGELGMRGLNGMNRHGFISLISHLPAGSFVIEQRPATEWRFAAYCIDPVSRLPKPGIHAMFILEPFVPLMENGMLDPSCDPNMVPENMSRVLSEIHASVLAEPNPFQMHCVSLRDPSMRANTHGASVYSLVRPSQTSHRTCRLHSLRWTYHERAARQSARALQVLERRHARVRGRRS